MYTPPFRLTARIIELISEISEKIGEINVIRQDYFHVQLRRENRIKTIHSSLAIENNSLSMEQITAIIDGKHVLGNPSEIQEVKNAVQVYDLLSSFSFCSEKDLFKAHKLMMQDLVSRSGQYRNDGVGIFNGSDVVHVAPPADRVPFLMAYLTLREDMKNCKVVSGNIPKVIHYAWFGPGKYNATILKCMETWKKILPEYKFKLWNEKNFPWQRYPFAKEAMEKGRWVFVADVARMHALFNEGGIYLDTDIEVLRPFDNLLNNDAFMSYESESQFNIGVFGAKKNHPFVKALLDWYKFVHCDDDYTEIASTRIMNKIMRMFCHIKLHGQEIDLPFGMHIYPKEYMCPEFRDDKWQVTKSTYAIHHFTGLW